MSPSKQAAPAELSTVRGGQQQACAAEIFCGTLLPVVEVGGVRVGWSTANVKRSLRVQRGTALCLHVQGNKTIFPCYLSSTDDFFLWTASEHLWVEKLCSLRKSGEEAVSFPRSLGWSSFLSFVRRNAKCYHHLTGR